MPRSDTAPHSRHIDWRGWIAFAWALAFGILYAEMLLKARAPGGIAAAARLCRDARIFLGGDIGRRFVSTGTVPRERTRRE